MSEHILEDPWSDEVCQDWVQMVSDKAEAVGFSLTEADISLIVEAPPAVQNYLDRKAIKGLADGIVRVFEEAQGSPRVFKGRW